MSEKHLHIISFDIPFPADYGGVVDIYNRIRTLSELGVKIHLHCFEYGRERSEVLSGLCYSIYYYKRNTSVVNLFSALPYIVVSRQSDELINNLLKDDYPVLMEGIHTTFYISDKRLNGRKMIVRSHNIEHEYYHHLSEIETHPFKKMYFRREASKLKKYEPELKKASNIAAISPDDSLYIKNNYGNGFYLPAFHGNDEVNCFPGRGTYALYHGNLSVGENNSAALFLIRVFSTINYPLIIAGNHPSADLKAAASKNKNIQLVINPGVAEMQQLIQNAHVNILPTFQSTGIKLKLINALFNGRFCIVNTHMIKNTGLESLCIVKDTEMEMRTALDEVFTKEFSYAEIEERKKVLLNDFDNKVNAIQLMKVLGFKFY